MNTILFLCTGNYYRSRFAEMYFRHLAAKLGLNWRSDSRGLRLYAGNVGSNSLHTITECQRFGIAPDLSRWPLELVENDLANAEIVIAVKETEHRPLVRMRYPFWEDRIEYWEIHDVDFATAEEALPLLRREVNFLVERLLKDGNNQ